MQPCENRDASQLPDPFLFDTEALLRELDRCREIVLRIPTNGDCNATHFAIQHAVNAIWTLRENIRYLVQLRGEGQRAFRRRHQLPEEALSQQPPRRFHCRKQTDLRKRFGWN
jgi:hypothetical protein